MPRDPDLYDFFVSYARSDNKDGWIEQFIHALLKEHVQFSGGRELTYFFDKSHIPNLSYWETEIFNKGIACSRLFLAFLSPSYFASEVCRKEWKAWIDQEIAKHILTEGAAPIYIVEVPGFISKPPLGEHEVAREVAKLCKITPDDRFDFSVSSLVKEFRRRQLELVQPFYNAGVTALQQEDIKQTLQRLGQHLDERAEHVRRAAESENTVPPYNEKFTGRHDELIELRRRLKDDRTGVICGIHGLGGIGKTELAYTYAHAFAGVYAGGRYLVRCEGESDLKQAMLRMDQDPFHDEITDEERKDPRAHFAAVLRALRNRLEQKGHVLLVLDNVDNADLVSRQQTDAVTVLGPHLHLLATTRLPAPVNANWLTLDELSQQEALDLLDKFRPIQTDEDRAGTESIVSKLGGFALAIELVAAGLAMHPSTTYSRVAAGLGLDDLGTLAENHDLELRRHNHEKRLRAVLEPTLAALRPEERRVLEYAAFLPPDQVALPWLKSLVVEEFPHLKETDKWGDGWEELIHRLIRLSLLTRVEEELTSQRLVRAHRLVQELVRDSFTLDESNRIESTIEELIEERVTNIDKTTNWQKATWELEPLDALAWLWDESRNARASWLLAWVAHFWDALAGWSRAEPLLRRALAIDEEDYGTEHPSVATRLNNLAQLLSDTNRLAEAEQLLHRSLAIEEQSFGANHPRVIICLSNLALLLQATNRMAEAEPLMRHALAIDEATFGVEHPNVAIRLNNLAQLLQATNRLAEAEPLIRRALAIDEASYGSEHPNVAICLNNLGQLYYTKNRLAEAEPLMRRALAIDEQSYGAKHPNVARDLNNLAQLLKETNHLAEAEPLMRQALAIDEMSYGGEHPNVAIGLNNLALLLQATNRLAEGEPLMRRALAIDEASYGAEHPIIAHDLRILAQLLLATKRLAEAEPLMRRALAIDETSYGGEQPNVARDLNYLALLLYDTNRRAEAEPLLRRSLAIFEKSFGPDHSDVATVRGNLATLLRATNRSAEAEQLMRRAGQ